MRQRLHVIVLLLVSALPVAAFMAGCGDGDVPVRELAADARDQLDLVTTGTVRVTPTPGAGFLHAYYLHWPAGLDTCTAPTAAHLLVVPNNTGTAEDEIAVHEDRVRRDVMGRGASFASTLPAALLMPVFPRPADRWRVYTHALDRDVMTLPDDDPLARLDRQLLAMIDHARTLLAGSGHELAPDVLMFGFSASGTFVNRFTALHPERVCGVAAGGVNGLPILPRGQLDGERLPFPIGVADLGELTGRPFAADAWREVPQLVFMGAADANDTLPYDDAWNDDERALIGRVLGETMMPDRWERAQELLADVPGLTLRTYAGRGHEVDDEIAADVRAFLRAAAAPAAPAGR
jgi:dienelactone hydrolase